MHLHHHRHHRRRRRQPPSDLSDRQKDSSKLPQKRTIFFRLLGDVSSANPTPSSRHHPIPLPALPLSAPRSPSAFSSLRRHRNDPPIAMSPSPFALRHPSSFSSLFLLLSLLPALLPWRSADAVGVNWGTQASHRLPAKIVVQMLKDNNFTKVKLFDTDPNTMSALSGTNIEVMVAIPNLYLQDMTDLPTAKSFVKNNVTRYMFEGGVNIKYVAVGNEPFLTSYNGSYINLTFPALQNVQNALNDAKLGDTIKVTVPMNADVLSSTGAPSSGAFRSDIAPQMTQIVNFLDQNGCPYTINIYPFISLNSDPSFPQNYAFFDSTVAQITDVNYSYTNTFDASYDTLVVALTKINHPNIPIIVGEVGWPTDGVKAANVANAQRFNQGFLNHVKNNAGTPRRRNTDIHYYLFSLLDEDQKSIDPGTFERHWGIFAYDGTAKYTLTVPGSPLNSNGNGTLVNAKGVSYLPRRWCILSANADLLSLQGPVSYACQYSDCTELGYGASCNGILSSRQNASYAFNQYFQIQSQAAGSCNFDGLGTITQDDPSVGACKFIVQIDASSAPSLLLPAPVSAILVLLPLYMLLML